MSISMNQITASTDATMEEKLDYSNQDKNSLFNTNIPSFSKLTSDLIRFNRIVELNLKECGLETLPEVSLEALKRLNISYNKFKSFPNTIFNWSSLEEIVANQNSIESLPDLFAKLNSLNVLNLECNPICRLPPSLQEHEKLEELDLGSTCIGSDLKELKLVNPSLKKINFFMNGLEAVPQCILKLKSLERLSFYNNCITSIVDLQKVETLRELNLMSNSIEDFNEIINLTQLQKLEVEIKTKEEVHFDFSCMNNLKVLRITGEIKNSRISANISSLEEFSSRFGYLKTMPDIFEARKLKRLDLLGNCISEVPKDIGKFVHLQKLNLYGSNLNSFPESAKFDKLTKVDFTYNRFEKIPCFIFSCKNLEILNLNNNKIKSIPDSISTLENLKVLRIAANKVLEVSENLFQLVDLEYLTLANNRIEILPNNFEEFKNMKKLYLLNNKLTEFPASIANMEKLQEVDFSDNPFEVEPDLSSFTNRKIKVNRAGACVLM